MKGRASRHVLTLSWFSGSNLQALIDSTRDPKSSSHIVVVISNKAGVAGLDKAEKAGIPTRVSHHRERAASGCWVVCCVVRAVPPGATAATTTHSAKCILCFHSVCGYVILELPVWGGCWVCSSPACSSASPPVAPSSPLTCSLCKGCI